VASKTHKSWWLWTINTYNKNLTRSLSKFAKRSSVPERQNYDETLFRDIFGTSCIAVS